MAEMAAEYRVASAQLAMRIRAMEAAHTDPARVRALRRILQELRAVQRTLSGYYDLPRDPEITSAGWRGRGPSQDDH